MSEKVNIFGQRFGRLLAAKEVGKNPAGRALWLCKCECGGEKVVDGIRLRNGAVKSCGCIKKEGIRTTHGHARNGKLRSSTYSSWHHMRQRCFNQRSPKWEQYGGRGITVCARWRESFDAFLEDMGECPSGHTIDRINVDGNYEPGNCRWADARTQSRNVRRNLYLTLDGETLPIWDWAERIGIDASTLNMRKLRGWSDHDALTVPKGARR